uniref:Zinc knuckle CX2CX4HX4C domain-containing protein n=1 Tax=Quercus lobata TaxID=97700 RepID=A0A7N2MZ67_QUELO
MDDLTDQCARLSLHTKERQTIPLTSVIEHNSRDFEVRDLTQNTVLLLFTLESNVQKILSQGPWTFDKYLSRYVDLGGSEPHWISFQYEGLPVFCYWYGLLNHDEKDCRLWVDSGEHLQKHEQQYGPWLRASLTNIQQAQVVHTKSPHSTGPPQPQRPTPSPIMRPSFQTPNISPPMSDPPSSSQTDATITHIESTTTPLPPTPHTLLTFQKIPETTTTPMYHFETEKKEALHGTIRFEILQGTVHDTLQNENLHSTVQGTWRRLGLPRDLMNSTTSSESVLRSKRKQHSLPSVVDPLTDKKQKLLDMVAKALGKIMVENLGSVVAARQHHRAQ